MKRKQIGCYAFSKLEISGLRLCPSIRKFYLRMIIPKVFNRKGLSFVL